MHAACSYLASKYPEKGLGGTDAKSRAAVDNWMEVEAHNLDAYTGVRQGFPIARNTILPFLQRLQSAVRRAMNISMPCRLGSRLFCSSALRCQYRAWPSSGCSGRSCLGRIQTRPRWQRPWRAWRRRCRCWTSGWPPTNTWRVSAELSYTEHLRRECLPLVWALRIYRSSLCGKDHQSIWFLAQNMYCPLHWADAWPVSAFVGMPCLAPLPAGDSFSIADIAPMPGLRLVMTAAGGGNLVAKYPNVQVLV